MDLAAGMAGRASYRLPGSEADLEIGGNPSRGICRAGSSGGGTRTHNTSVNSRVLCQLSYPGIWCLLRLLDPTPPLRPSLNVPRARRRRPRPRRRRLSAGARRPLGRENADSPPISGRCELPVSGMTKRHSLFAKFHHPLTFLSCRAWRVGQGFLPPVFVITPPRFRSGGPATATSRRHVSRRAAHARPAAPRCSDALFQSCHHCPDRLEHTLALACQRRRFGA